MRELDGIRHREIVVDRAGGGVRLHYVESEAPAERPPLVLLPGQSMPWESYCKVIPDLIRRYHVLAVDLRGHGRSDHTPGRYSFGRCAADIIELVREVVGRPCILCGNSSGGIIAMLVASRSPEWARAVLMEDPPLFSTNWPRLRDDTWVHGFFAHTVATLPDLPRYFSTLKIPSQGRKRLMSFPRPLAWLLGGAIRRRLAAHPGEPVDIPWLPLHVRLFVRGLSEYDVDFTRACVDGRMCDVVQEDEFAAVRCPISLMTAYSFRHPELGLVGAMDEADVALARRLQPNLVVSRFDKPHIIHIAAPTAWRRVLDDLASASLTASSPSPY